MLKWPVFPVFMFRDDLGPWRIGIVPAALENPETIRTNFNSEVK